jgi:hypothetical protein
MPASTRRYKEILNVLVKNQEATKKKRKVFQYIGKDEDNDGGNEITSVDKGKRAKESGSTQTTINQLLKKDFREEACQ